MSDQGRPTTRADLEADSFLRLGYNLNEAFRRLDAGELTEQGAEYAGLLRHLAEKWGLK